MLDPHEAFGNEIPEENVLLPLLALHKAKQTFPVATEYTVDISCYRFGCSGIEFNTYFLYDTTYVD